MPEAILNPLPQHPTANDSLVTAAVPEGGGEDFASLLRGSTAAPGEGDAQRQLTESVETAPGEPGSAVTPPNDGESDEVIDEVEGEQADPSDDEGAGSPVDINTGAAPALNGTSASVADAVPVGGAIPPEPSGRASETEVALNTDRLSRPVSAPVDGVQRGRPVAAATADASGTTARATGEAVDGALEQTTVSGDSEAPEPASAVRGATMPSENGEVARGPVLVPAATAQRQAEPAPDSPATTSVSAGHTDESDGEAHGDPAGSDREHGDRGGEQRASASPGGAPSLDDEAAPAAAPARETPGDASRVITTAGGEPPVVESASRPEPTGASASAVEPTAASSARETQPAAPARLAPALTASQGDTPEPPRSVQQANERITLASVQRGLNAALAQRGGEMTIRLAPESLGALRISMSVTGGVVSASFAADSAEAIRTLRAGLDGLRESIEARGLQVDRLRIAPAPATQAGAESGDARSDQGAQRRDDARSDAEGRSRGRGEHHRDTGERQQRQSSQSRFNQQWKLALDATA